MRRRDRRGEGGLAVWATLGAGPPRAEGVSVWTGLGDWWRDRGASVAKPTCRESTYVARCGEEGCRGNQARVVTVKRDCSKELGPCSADFCLQPLETE